MTFRNLVARLPLALFFLVLDVWSRGPGAAAVVRPPLELPEVTPGGAIPLYSWGLPRPDDPHRLTGRLAWRRVDGAAMMIGYRYAAVDTQPPASAVEIGYSPARERLLAAMEARCQPRPGLILVVSTWSTTRPFAGDDEIAGSTENTLAAVLAGEDYRDYYDGRGGRVGLARIRGALTIEAQLQMERRRGLATAVKAMPFRDSAPRPTEHFPDQESRMGRISLALGRRPTPVDCGYPVTSSVAPRSGREIRFTWESAGGVFGGDVDHDRVVLEGWAVAAPAPRHEIATRVALGTNLRGALDPPDLFRLGGPGTLRGHGLNSLRGDRQIFLNGEYSFGIRGPLQLMAGVDAGRAWSHRREPQGGRLEVDGVVGVQSADRRISIQAARNIRDSGATAIIRVRTNTTF